MNELFHYGTPRHSGRYPWGSGENPYQRPPGFRGRVRALRKQGLSDKEIAAGMDMGLKEFRARYTIARQEEEKEKMMKALKLKNKGYSNIAIGEAMGINESSVRNLLKKAEEPRQNEIEQTANILRDNVKSKTYIDIGPGTELYLGTNRTKFDTAVQYLKDTEGYKVIQVQVDQLGTNHKTTISVLAPKDATYKDIVQNHMGDIRMVGDFTIDNGETVLGVPKKITSVKSDRIKINYAEDGGEDKDGVIEIRRGVSDISLGNASYAQARIAVDGTHYLKGMVMYADDLPDGVDIRYNTNKAQGTPKEKVFKPMKVAVKGLVDEDGKEIKDVNQLAKMGWSKKDILAAIDKDNPFGATIKGEEQLHAVQRYYTDEKGKKHISPINVVYEEGDWGEWSKTLSSQMLSKQTPELAKKQLGISYQEKLDEYESIRVLTNPAIKKKLLESFADDCDASAVHLKAAALPRQATHVILPITDIKENEIFAPNYNDGEKVVLIRYPHGGIFEIPELVVNNKQKTAKSVIGSNAIDAVGINAKVAKRLSGADFDGDTVLVIPTNNVKIKTKPPLEGLKDFEPKQYKLPPGAAVIKPQTKQNEMGRVSNLITDMTLKGATDQEIEKAVKHSMVVIDAEKHGLDYKQSYIDNDIRALKIKYQGENAKGQPAGASTLISKASSETHIPKRSQRTSIDEKTGEKIYYETGEKYVNKKGKEVIVTQASTQMADTNDAFSLSSGNRMENVYAAYANQMKSLANAARKETLGIPNIEYSPSANKTYRSEVDSLNAKLNIALRNAPKERQAQLIANQTVKLKQEDNPGMDHDSLKKIKGQALTAARSRVGAKKTQIAITDREWEAIQSGAITNTKLIAILNNTDLDDIKRRATPRAQQGLTASQESRIKSMQASGRTNREIANALGISTSTVSNVLNE